MDEYVGDARSGSLWAPSYTRGGYGWRFGLAWSARRLSHDGVASVEVWLWPMEEIAYGTIYSGLRRVYASVTVGGSTQQASFSWGGDDDSYEWSAVHVGWRGDEGSVQTYDRVTGDSGTYGARLLFTWTGWGQIDVSLHGQDGSANGVYGNITIVSWASGELRSGTQSIALPSAIALPTAPEVSGASVSGWTASVRYGMGNASSDPNSRTNVTGPTYRSATLTPSVGSWSASGKSIQVSGDGSFSHPVSGPTSFSVGYRSDGRDVYSDPFAVFPPPKPPSLLSADPVGSYGVRLSWENSQDGDAYVTRVYSGSVSAKDGALSVGSDAVLEAELGAGVTEWSSGSVWEQGGGQTTKSFTVVQVSSRDAWSYGGKQSVALRWLDGLASASRSLSVTNGAMPPAAPYGFSADNVADGVASSSEVSTSWRCRAPDGEQVRDGFRVVGDDGVTYFSEEDSSSGDDAEHEAELGVSIEGARLGLRACAYSRNGEAYSPWAYVLGPAHAGSVELARDRSQGYERISAHVTYPTGGYDPSYSITLSAGGESVGMSGVLDASSGFADVVTGAVTDAFVAGDVSCTLVMGAPGRGSEWDSAESAASLSPGACPPVGLRASQLSDEDESLFKASWEPPFGDALDGELSFELEADGSPADVTSGPSYDARSGRYAASFRHDVTGSASTLRVRSRRGSEESVWASCEFTYVPQELRPPEISDGGHVSGNTYLIRVDRPARGGRKIDGGYAYQVYAGNVRDASQSPESTKVLTASEVASGITVSVTSPNWTYYRVTARDADGESAPSEAVRLRHVASGVGVFCHGCPDLKIEDCCIENAVTCVRASGGSDVTLVGVTMAKASGSDAACYYDVDETSRVHESDTEWK